ncbi:neutral zinc metallopeptidase [Enemella evansiae]|uniref:neutral zinc metallopeptidase n=1 Tax=Enemella evansiae TaxID=2016499 RepID=UPI000B96AC05|nr:neutral zinc metallopeptidase [Enemella evansiae]OYO00192.1 hypothetical protein CGZ97_19390 [Enemella evansiae]
MSQGYPGGPGQQGYGQQPGFGRQPGFGQAYPTGWQQPQSPWGQPQGQPGGYGVPQQYSQGPYGSPQFPPPSPRPKSRMRPVLLAALAIVGLAIAGFVINSMRQPAYQNEDYTPPPPGNVKPFPDAPVSEVKSITDDNALYRQQVPVPVRCEMRDPDMNLRTATDQEVKDYIDDLMGCNMRVWNPPFTGTGKYELVRPIVNVYGESVTSPCGGGKAMGPNAMYCAANQQVYYSRKIQDANPALAVMIEPHVIDEVMAHEFGHSIQARTLILQANQYQQVQSDDKKAALEMSRRIELQADCFAGMYLQSVGRSMNYTDQNWQDIQTSIRNGGDDILTGKPNVDGTHGLGDSRLYWGQLGLTNTDIGKCNTMTAPSQFVR